MLSYRHAFHAGNHADVLKHTTLLATLRHLLQKDTALTLIDTHAGAGLYRLDGKESRTSAESAGGVGALIEHLQAEKISPDAALADYIELIHGLNPDGVMKNYPGSPAILQALMRRGAEGGPRDRLKLFELHPSDHKLLAANLEAWRLSRSAALVMGDGFAGLRPLLPPAPDGSGSRRALVLMDPSYEIKTDYAKVADAVQDGLKRFATGVYLVWYPIVPRLEAHGLPKRLKTLAQQAGKPWLHATLNIGGIDRVAGAHADAQLARQAQLDKARQQGRTYTPQRSLQRGPISAGGLRASGVFVINPPHTLKDQLKPALAHMLAALGQGTGQGTTLDTGG